MCKRGATQVCRAECSFWYELIASTGAQKCHAWPAFTKNRRLMDVARGPVNQKEETCPKPTQYLVDFLRAWLQTPRPASTFLSNTSPPSVSTKIIFNTENTIAF